MKQDNYDSMIGLSVIDRRDQKMQGTITGLVREGTSVYFVIDNGAETYETSAQGSVLMLDLFGTMRQRIPSLTPSYVEIT